MTASGYAAGEGLPSTAGVILWCAAAWNRPDLQAPPAVAETDWDVLLATATEHRILPLVYRTLARSGLDAVPPRIVRTLRHFYIWNTQSNLYRLARLIQVIDTLRKSGIPALPFKGPVLAALAYRDLALRQFTDLDILLSKADIAGAVAVLRSEGFELQGPSTLDAKDLEEDKHVVMVDRSGVVLEVHWALCSPRFSFPVDIQVLQQNATVVDVAGSSLPSIAVEDLFSVLSIHAAKHSWSRLNWICDIAQMVHHHPEMDWRRVQDAARASRCTRTLLLALMLSRELLHVRLPEEMNAAVNNDRSLPELMKTIVKWTFTPAEEEDAGAFERAMFFMKTRECLRDRLSFGEHYIRSKLIPTDTEKAVVNLPGSLHWMYYLLRPARLARVYGPEICTRLVRAMLANGR